jgi:hypothetical protein
VKTRLDTDFFWKYITIYILKWRECLRRGSGYLVVSVKEKFVPDLFYASRKIIIEVITCNRWLTITKFKFIIV